MNDFVKNIISSNKKNICISVTDYTRYFLNDYDVYKMIDVNSVPLNKTNLLCCHILGINVFIGGHVEDGYIKFSDGLPNGRKSRDWTIPVPIEFINQFDRISKLKAFL